MTFALLAGGLALAVAACLAFAFQGPNRGPGDPGGPAARRGLMLAALLVPALAGGVYLLVGRPDLAAAPPPAAGAGAAGIARLERAAAADPGNPLAWRRLAVALDGESLHAEAAEAWLRSAALPGGDGPDVLVHAAESLILAASGDVPERAQELVARALDREPDHLRGRFYAGLALLQAEDPQGALRAWTAVLKDTPEDAPYRSMIEEGIREAAARAGDPLPEGVSAPPDPGMEQIRAMVDGLAARLAESPGDLKGWKRLGRSRRVLGENGAAYEAYLRALDLAPGDAEALAGAAEAKLMAAVEEGAPPDEAVGLFRRLLEVEPDHALGLFVVAEDASRRGEKEAARGLFARLLGRMPEEDPARAAVQERLEALDGDG